MLQKLLSSKNPDDLRAANRLIREMVRRVSPPVVIPTVEPPNKEHFGANSFVPCREVVPISEGPPSEVPLYMATSVCVQHYTLCSSVHCALPRDLSLANFVSFNPRRACMARATVLGFTL